MANANASRICHLLDIYDRHHGDEMNEEKGTRCNELKVLASILFRSKYGRELVRTTDKTVCASGRRVQNVDVRTY